MAGINVAFVSSRGIVLSSADKKYIGGLFPSNPEAQRKLFVKMLEHAAWEGLRPAGYFGYRLGCANGRPAWYDEAHSNISENRFENKAARTAIENVSVLFFEDSKLDGRQPIQLDLMICSHSHEGAKNAAFSIRYDFRGKETIQSGALFVSGGSQYDEMVAKACNSFAAAVGGNVCLSTVKEPTS